MKRIICTMLTLMMIFGLFSCDNSKKSTTSTTSTSSTPTVETTNPEKEKEAEFTAASSAYKSLISVNASCEIIMDSIYGAWYYTIYEEDDHLYYDSALSAFCSRTGLKKDAVSAAVEKELNILHASGLEKSDYARNSILSVTRTAINVVLGVYEDAGILELMDKDLESAKESMKSVTAKYDDYTGYATLKSYYSEVSSYFEFCKNPTGSFNQLQTTIENYENNCRKYKSDLGFIFD